MDTCLTVPISRKQFANLISSVFELRPRGVVIDTWKTTARKNMGNCGRLFASFIALSAGLVISTCGQGVLTNGLVSYYPFNGNPDDAIAGHPNGVATGAQLTADRFGNANSAYSFDGKGAFISLPDSSAFSSPAYSVSLW